MKIHEKQPETMKSHKNISENHENQTTIVKKNIETHCQRWLIPNHRNSSVGNVCFKNICIASLQKKIIAIVSPQTFYHRSSRVSYNAIMRKSSSQAHLSTLATTWF